MSKPGLNNHILNASQLGLQTSFTRNGTLNMENRKPYRSKRQKAEARADAVKDSDGAYRSNVPVQYHKTGRGR